MLSSIWRRDHRSARRRAGRRAGRSVGGGDAPVERSVAGATTADRRPARRVDRPDWRLLARWKAAGHQVLPGIWYPITLYAVWRLAQLAVSVHLGGDAQYARLLLRLPALPAHHAHRLRAPGVDHAVQRLLPRRVVAGLAVVEADPVRPVHGAHRGHASPGWPPFIAVWGVSKSLRGERVARRAVLLFALFPSSLFLWALLQRGPVHRAGRRCPVGRSARQARAWPPCCSSLIGATRSVGILVPAVIVLCRIIRQRRIDKWCWAYAAAGASGLLAVLVMHAGPDGRRLLLHEGAEGLGPLAEHAVDHRDAGLPEPVAARRARS